jgi:hypothetical protein
MQPAITLSRAMEDPKVFGGVFASPSFWTWKMVARLIDGLPLTEPREIALFEEITCRVYNRQARRAWRRLIILVGRRGGKDRFMSAVACWRALSQNWKMYASAGEGSVVILIGADKKQANILSKYCLGLLQAPLLAKQVKRIAGDVIEFSNGSSLEIIVNDESLIRGRSAIAVLGTEACFWKTDEASSSSDEEVVSAAEPSMAMSPDGELLLLSSSVHRKKGYMHRQYRRLYGKDRDTDTLCLFATSKTMNPRLPQKIIDAALARDSAKARAEYENVWREDSSDLLPLDIIEAATDWGITHRFRVPGARYIAYADMATGTNQGDSAALAIAHQVDDAAKSVLVDVTQERRPRFVLADVITDWANLLRGYGINKVWSDGYAFKICADLWARSGIENLKSENDTSDNYLQVLPLLTSKRGRLHDDATLRKQLSGLSRVVKSGHEVVEHPRTSTAHDDVAAAVCGALVQAAKLSRHPVITAERFAWIVSWPQRRGFGDPRLSHETVYARQLRRNARG